MKKFCLSWLLSSIALTGAVAQVTVTATGGAPSLPYTNLGQAFNAINSGVHSGAISIAISGTSTETGSCVLHSSGAGSASYTSVNIFPSTDGSIVQGPTLQGRGLIELNGADNVTIDGDNPNTPGINRDLTFTNTAANTVTLTSVIRLAVNSGVSVGNTDNITIKNSIINGSAANISATLTSGVVDNTMGIYGGGIPSGGGATTAPTAITGVNNASAGTMNDLVISNNEINKCARGISINGNSKPAINNLTVTNNMVGNPTIPGPPPYSGNINGVYAVAITLQGSTLCTVSGNTVNVLSSNAGPIRGMEIQGQSAATLVFQNNIVAYVANGTSSTACEGLFFDGITISANITGNIVKNIFGQRNSVATVAINWNNGASIPAFIENNNINKIYNYATTVSPSIGILMSNASTGNLTIRNNFISDITSRSGVTPPNTTTEQMGIKIAAGTGYKILNNTIHMNAAPISGTNPSGNTCLMVSTTGATGMDIRNNIFSMQMPGWPTGSVNSCIQFPTGLGTGFNCILNNNAYYAGNGGVIAQMTSGTTTYTAANFSVNATTPATNWRAYSSGFSTAGTNDNASLAITTAPPFVSGTDFHLFSAVATPLESGGANVGVTTDVDGDVRPGPVGSINGGATFPDMGADEFDGIPLDVIPPAISYTALASTCLTGDRTINVTITDSRGVPTSGADMPRIYYRKGAGAWSSAAGVLTSGVATNGVWTFTITATDLGGLTGADQVSYYVVAQDAAANISATPGSGFSATNVNTITTPPTTPSSYFVQPSLGTFDVGVGKPFTTITAAVNSYNTNTCLTGHIIYNLTDNTYPTESYPINIANNPLAAPGVTMTIKPAPATAVTITGGVALGTMIKLTDARYITIDGVNTGGASLTLINNQAGNNQGNIWIASSGAGCNNITLKNMNIIGGAPVPNITAADGFGIVATTATGSVGRNEAADNDNITITGNYIVRCGYAIWAAGNNTISAGALDNWVISNNIIGPVTGPLSSDSTMGVNGLFFRKMVNFEFSNNLVRNIGSTTNTQYTSVGLNLENGINRAVIKNNVFDGHFSIKANDRGHVLNFGNSGSTITNSIISGNTFKNIVCTGTGGALRAIYVGTSATNCNDTIVNNTITDVYGLSGTTAVSNWPIGILVDGSGGTGLKIWHNTINMFGPHGGAAGNSGSAAIYINSYGGNLDLRNNNLVNTYDNTGSTTEKNYALYSVPANTIFAGIDNNNYYVTGTGNDAAFIAGNACPDISAIRNFFGSNMNSLTIDPGFLSATDLHITPGVNSGLESAGANLGVAADMDGQARPGPAGSVNGGGSLPDIGADEFDGIPVDGVMPSVSYTALTSTCVAGDRVITATISDNQGIITTGANVPRIYMRRSTEAYVSSPGALVSGNALSSVWSFTISPTAFTPALAPGEQVFYFIVAQDGGNNVAGFPGAGITGTNVNAVTPATNPSMYNVLPASGTFDVGVGKNYQTISSAVNAYNINTCLTGPIVYRLTDNTYPTESYPINILNNPLASPSITMTIRPAAGTTVTVSGTAPQTSAMFKFSDARYITMDGLNTGGASLSLINTNTTQDNNANIWLSSQGSGNKNITLTNLKITGGANVVGSSAALWAIIACGTTTGNNAGPDNDNITITNNTFIRTGYAVLANGGGPTSAGGNDNWVVNNNILGPDTRNATDGMGVNAMFFRNMLNMDLSNNQVRHLGASFFSPACFYLELNIDRVTMRNNTIDGVVSAVNGTTQIVHIGGGVINSIFSGNTFRNISSTSTTWSMRVFNVATGVPNSNDTIVNNVITGVTTNAGTNTVTTWPVGVYVDIANTGNVKIWHNTINFANSYNTGNIASGSACILTTAAAGIANIDVRNNILVNTYDNTGSANDKHYGIYSLAPATAFTNVDHNNYYVTGGAALSALGFIGSDRANVAAMQAGFGNNTHSVSVLPGFVSGTDMHITPHVMTPLESGAANVGVTTDRDGVTRPGTTTHSAGLLGDIGAYEFDGILQDIVPPSITYTPLTGACGVGNRTIVATITDATGVNNTTTFKPRIYYKLSSAGSYTLSQQGVSLGGNQWSFTIVAADMPSLAIGNTVQYFIVAQDNVTPTPNVGATPGPGLVAANVNTITTPPTTPASYQVFPSLGGNYTVGAGGGRDYPTITAAIAAYNGACLNDHVTFTLMDANYSTSETFPLPIASNPFADADHTLTIKPNAGQNVTITSTSAAAIFKLSNAKYVIIDGVNAGGASLNLVNNNAGTNTCNIWLGSTAAVGAGNKNITLRNMNITGGTNNPTSALGWGIIASNNGSIGNNSTGGDNDNITISGNTFLKCGYAILSSGSGTASAGANDNWVVTNNIVGPAVSNSATNMGVNAMFFRNMVNLEISDNTLQNVGSTAANFGTAAIYLEAGINRAVIRRNVITNLTSINAGSSIGIHIGTSVINSIIANNTISGCINTNTGGYSIRAIGVNANTANINDTIVNNMISDVYSYSFNALPTTATNRWPMGILVESSGSGANAASGLCIWNNTINMYGPHPGVSGNGGNAALLIISNPLNPITGINMRNNIFANTYDNTGSATEKSYAIWALSASPATLFSVINNNSYYVNAQNNVLLGVGSTDVNNLAGIQSTLGGNTNSIIAAPSFVADNNLHLRLVNANYPFIAGTPIPQVTKDIDNTNRDALVPFIGAHEAEKCNGVVSAGAAVPVAPAICVSGVTTLNNTTSTPGIGVMLQWQSSEDSVSFTNISGATNDSYTIPTDITVTTYYRMKANCVFTGNRDSATTKIPVYPLPAVITGADGCFTYTTTLSNADLGGTWASSNTGVATITPTGVVSGLATGTTVISYTLPATGCTRTRTLTINPLPVAITGTPDVCVNGTTDLENTDANGTWSSSATAIATVNGTTGVVSGVHEGLVNISYTLPTGCFRAVSVSVDPLPAVAVTAATPGVICLGESAAFTASSPISTFTLLSQDFNGATIGDWTVDNFSADPVAYWQQVSIGYDGLTTGDGTKMMQSSPIITGAPVQTILNSPSFSTVDMQTATLTFNQYWFSDVIDGKMAVEYSTNGGANWQTLADFTGTTSPATETGTWSSTVALTTVALPADALNEPNVKLRWNYDGYIHWFIDNVTVKGSLPPATFTWTAPGSITEVSCPACATTTVTPTASGNVIYTVTATSSAGCNNPINATVSVNPLPQAITGNNLDLCLGFNTTLSSADAGGTWTSSNTTNVTIDPASGVANGLALGTATITYVLPTGCQTTAVVTVNPLPVAITGVTMQVCPATSITLTNTDAGGTWSSNDDAIATIGGTTGIVTGVSANTTTITYTLPTGCISTTTITVNPLPVAIGGTLAVCKGLTTTLTNTDLGGTWTSNDDAIATIDENTGVATGIAANSTTITYTLPTGCLTTATLTVNPLPVAITGATMEVCPGTTITLTNTDAGGTWSSNDDAIATVDETTGVVTGVSANTTTITYTLGTGCINTTTITVNPLPAAIGGTLAVCNGLTTTLTNTSTGGTWASNDDAIATIDQNTGLLTGISANTTTVTYTLPTGCLITAQVTVNPLPVAITGLTEVCVNSSITLANTDLGGTWSSGATSIATIGSSSGTLTGVSAGSVTVTYTLPTSCIATYTVTVNPLPVLHNVSGGGAYCEGSTGVHIGMAASETGTTYHLYNGATLLRSEAGTTGAPVDFGIYTVAATYTATATTSFGCTTNMLGSATVVITPTVLPTVTIGIAPTLVCQGATATFTATPANGGAAPAYQWKVNGTPVTGAGTFSYAPVNGDIVEVTLTSNAVCPVPATVDATPFTVAVTNTLTPSVSITANPGNDICQFTTVTFTATPANGGTTPTYAWTRNGIPVGTAANVLAIAPADNDVIVARLTSSYACPAVNNVPSNNITMNVTDVFLPVVKINVLPGIVTKVGQTVTLNAVVTPAGHTATYQWYKNSTKLTGATNAIYISADFADNDSVTCEVAGVGECAYNSFNSVRMHRTTGVVNVNMNSNIRLIPNPNTGSFSVGGTLATTTDADVTLEVTNMLGQTVYTAKAKARNGVIDEKVLLNNTLANGMYMLTVHANDERKVFHFVLSK